MKGIVLAIALALVAVPAFAQDGNGAPSVPHYNVNILGKENCAGADLKGSNRHTIQVLPERRIGVVPDIASVMLPKLLPCQKADEISMSVRQFSAYGLASLELVNKVVPLDQLMVRARAIAQDLLCATPLSPAAVKEAVHRTDGTSFEEGIAALRSKTWPAFMKMLASDDAKEGARAFVEKRKPDWKGE